MLLLSLLKLLFNDPLMFILAVVILFFPLLISITFHEVAHGYIAYLFGDPTPKIQGRLTLNPLAHIDPAGVLMLLIVGIGWAKPVIINPNNIKGKTRLMLVAMAGPLVNIILAVIFTIILALLTAYSLIQTNPVLGVIALLCTLLIKINVILAIFNLMPIPPLDGSKFIIWLLPSKLSDLYLKLEPYGMVILLIILFTIGFDFILKTASNLQIILFNYIYNIIKAIV